jgi:hypothetical protein
MLANLQGAIEAMKGPHERFHNAAAKLKVLVPNHDTKEASACYEKEIRPACDEILSQLGRIEAVADQALSLQAPAQKQVYEKCLVSQTQANDLLDQLLKINTDFAAGVVRDGLQAASQATFRASRRMSRRPTRWPERPTRWLKRGAKRPLPAGWYSGRQWRPTASPLRLFHSRASLLFAWIFVAGS